MGYVGTIITMVIAGLIIYGIVYYGPDIWHKIQERGGEKISDLISNPALYDNKEVEVVGDIVLAPMAFSPFVDSYFYSSCCVAQGDYVLGIYTGVGTMTKPGWEVAGRVRVKGIFRSPNIILAKRIEST
jgi:hypothetical protein